MFPGLQAEFDQQDEIDGLKYLCAAIEDITSNVWQVNVTDLRDKEYDELIKSIDFQQKNIQYLIRESAVEEVVDF